MSCNDYSFHANIFKPGAPGFLKLFLCGCLYVCLCVCPPPRLLITSGVMWRDMDPIRLVNKFYSCYMAIVVVIINGCGLGIDMRHSH